MKKSDRHQWIVNYLSARSEIGGVRYRVNVLDRYFSDAYISATNAPCVITFVGANKCAQLSRDLSELFKAGKLKRARIGITGFGRFDGFPTWVWDYSLR